MSKNDEELNKKFYTIFNKDTNKIEYVTLKDLNNLDKTEINKLVEEKLKTKKEIKNQQYMGLKIKALNIPEGIRYIGCRAFEGCTELKSIYIPDSVLEIGWRCFKGCINLKYIRLSNSLKIINAMTFYNCLSLVEIKLPKSISSIDRSAFECCSNLTSIILPKKYNLFSIADDVIKGCDKLINIIVYEKTKENNILLISTRFKIWTYEQYSAVCIIQEAFRKARYCPEYKICQKIFCEGMHKIYESNNLNFD